MIIYLLHYCELRTNVPKLVCHIFQRKWAPRVTGVHVCGLCVGAVRLCIVQSTNGYFVHFGAG